MHWTSKTLLDWSIDRLRNADVENPRLNSELLLARGLDCNRNRIFMEPDRIIEWDEFDRYQEMLNRRVRREPLHYILKEREFWSRNFLVTTGVLIPRPETEFLIQVLLELNSKSAKSSPKILDIGTGSGILAITAALEISSCKVTAVDLSHDAIAIARHNARLHEVERKIHFLPGDIFSKSVCQFLQVYDVILCNPPYVPSFHIPQVMPEVRNFEPHPALDGGPDGLSFYRRLIPKATDWLKPEGHLILEIGDNQEPSVSEMFLEYFKDFKYVSDYAQKPRVVFAKKQSHG